jgi:hypothetical protein
MSARQTARSAVAAALVAVLGCGGSSGTPALPPLSFSGTPAVTTASSSGDLSIAVWWSPLQPTVGYDAAQLAVTDLMGAPVSGATLTVVPWMLAHGHGSSVLPAVSETSPGIYVATPLDFYMSGTWELRTRIQRAGDGGAGDRGAGDSGTIDDTAHPTVDIP